MHSLAKILTLMFVLLYLLKLVYVFGLFLVLTFCVGVLHPPKQIGAKSDIHQDLFQRFVVFLCRVITFLHTSIMFYF